MSCTKPKYAPFPDICVTQPTIKKDCAIKECPHYKYEVSDLITDKIKVSVIMPFFEKIKTVHKAIESVLNQTFPNFELIIINDGDTHTEKDIVKTRDSRIKYVDLIDNHGQSVARNEGFKHSTGNYIAYLDADDEWLPNHLEKSLEIIVEGYHVVYGNFAYKHYFSDGEPIIIDYTYGSSTIDNLSNILQKDNPISINTVVHRRDVFIAAGGFEPGVVCGEDGVLWRRMIVAGAKFGFKEERTSYYCRYNHIYNDYHQSEILHMPTAIEGKHLIGNKTNGQELDIQENYDKRVKDLQGKGIKYNTLPQ